METANHKNVSIIVAIWNVEPYIRRCLDSIIFQTYPFLDVILVDDGSPDNCGEICDEYARKDSRFKVIHQANQGVSVARQVGLDAATGDYVIHVDPDDYMELDMIEKLLYEIEKRNLDILTCNYFNNVGREVCCTYQNCEELLKKLTFGKIFFCLWNTFIRLDFIKEHKLSFTPSNLSHHEDILFIVRCIVAGGKIGHLKVPLYHYIIRDDGLVMTRSKKAFMSILIYVNELTELINIKLYDGLFCWKQYAYIYAYESRYWKEMKSLYPEIRERLLNGKNSDRYSIDSQLARCMKYPPCLVWLEAKLHKYLMIFLHKGFLIFKK